MLCTDWREPGLWKPLFLTKNVSPRVQQKGKVAFGGASVTVSIFWAVLHEEMYGIGCISSISTIT